MARKHRILPLIVKVIVSSVLLLFLVSRTGADRLVQTFRGVNLVSFITSALLYVFSIFISSIRWQLLLMKGLGLTRLFTLYLMGSFFNNLMPGIIGGDAIKAYYLSRDINQTSLKGLKNIAPSSVSLASVFMDRYIGFVSLLIIAILAHPFGMGYFRGSYIEWLLPLIILAFIAGSYILFFFRLGSKIRFIAGFYEYLQSYRQNKEILLKCLLLSLSLQLVVILSAYIISKGLNINIPFHFLSIIIPLISVISSIPVSISGLGVREASFVILLTPLGVSQAQAITLSLTWFLSFAAGSLPGLFFYLSQYQRKSNP